MPKTKPEPLTDAEMDSLTLEYGKNLFYQTLFELAKKTGRRLGEFYGVEKKIKIGEKIIGKKKVYTVEGQQIEIDKSRDIFKATGKYDYGLKGKDIIFNDDGTAIMKTWVLKRRNYIQDETYIDKATTNLVKRFIKKYNIGLDDYMFRLKSYRAIQNAITTYAKKAGIEKNVSFHTFRHYFITHLLKKGWSHNEVAKVTGHKSVASISSYDHVLSSDLKDKLNLALEGI